VNSRLVRRIALRVLAVGIIALVTWLFARALIEGWDRVSEYDIAVDGWWVAACVLFAAAVAVSGVLWGRVLRALSPGMQLPVSEAVRSHLAGWVMRYIPGVGSVLYKVAWAQKRGVSRTTAVVGFTYESIFLQIASIMGGAVVLLIVVGPALFEDNGMVVVAVAVLLGVLVLGVSRPVVRPVLRFVTARRLKERVESLPLLATPRSLVFAVEFLAPRIINGVGVAFIAISIFDSPARDWFTIGAAYAVAGAIGILAVFVPGGLGVREGAFVGILTAAGFNIIDAIVLAVAARFVSTVADLLVAGVYGLLTVNLRRKKGTST
jgi:glycosyltransferase 2 family protein